MMQQLKTRQCQVHLLLNFENLVLFTKINLMVRKKSVEKVSSASAISKIKHLLQQQKESLQENRTAKLWL